MESALRECGGQPGLRLIETMLWDGAGVPRLSRHAARMAAAARALGWADAPGLATADLAGAVAAAGLSGPARLRATLGCAANLVVEAGPLPPARPLWRLGLATARLSSADPWLRIKSTRRAVYDAARAALPAGLDEVLFLNERGEICEGTITSVFFDRGQGLRTPPLSCGLLPGVLRAELACPEEVLSATDLPRVRLWVGNALRGLMAAEWVGGDAGA